MTEQDLQALESHLGSPLPAFYRATLSDYPFDPDSCAAEYLLPDNSQFVIELNSSGLLLDGVEKPFFIGSDGGEESYFIDASKADSGVYVYDVETGEHRQLVPEWQGFLDHIRSIHAEVAADEEAMRLSKLNKKWWEFWK